MSRILLLKAPCAGVTGSDELLAARRDERILQYAGSLTGQLLLIGLESGRGSYALQPEILARVSCGEGQWSSLHCLSISIKAWSSTLSIPFSTLACCIGDSEHPDPVALMLAHMCKLLKLLSYLTPATAAMP